jgi:hypothetical protein
MGWLSFLSNADARAAEKAAGAEDQASPVAGQNEAR